MHETRKWVRKAGAGCVVAALLLAVLEGLLSFAAVAVDLWRIPELPERRHTQFDRELGWRNVPGIRIEDMYGEGLGLTIDPRGFRSVEPITSSAPAGRVRLVCSGDSFTLGYGVDDARTWPHRLEVIDPRIQTVNMGQSGYGVDQAYLWYRQEEARLEHDVLLFCFIADDFERLRTRSFSGYPKPLLRRRGDTLEVVEATPPPPAWLRRLRRGRRSMKRLALYRALRRLIGPLAEGNAGQPSMDVDEGRRIAEAVFADLAARSRAAGRSLVLVYLPDRQDVQRGALSRWGLFARGAAERLKVPFVDVTEAMDGERWRDGEGLFQPGNDHYTDQGNEITARWLYDRLREVPSISARLAPGTR